VDDDPIEDEPGDDRVNLALGKPVTASSTHPGANGTLVANNLTDGDPATRWAAADDAAYPITLDVDFGAETTNCSFDPASRRHCRTPICRSRSLGCRS
jgi:hypothetical protein